MKKYQYLLLFSLSLLGLTGCKPDAPDGSNLAAEECIDEVVMPSKIEVEGGTVNITAAPPITDAKTLEGIKKRTVESKLKNDECCPAPESIKPCCCDEVLEKFEALLKKNDFKGAGDLKAKDPFYDSCKNKYDDFEGKISATQKKYL